MTDGAADEVETDDLDDRAHPPEGRDLRGLNVVRRDGHREHRPRVVRRVLWGLLDTCPDAVGIILDLDREQFQAVINVEKTLLTD